MKNFIIHLFLFISIISKAQTSQIKIGSQKRDCNSNLIYAANSNFKSFPLQSVPSSILYDSIRALSEINDIANADAYPWISSDGLRLYYIHGTGGTGLSNEIMFTQRTNTNSIFAAPTLIPIAVSNPFSIWLSTNELDAYICSDSLYFAHRNTLILPFNTPTSITLLSPYSNINYKNASLDSFQNTLYVGAFNNGLYLGIFEFSRTSPTSFTYTRTLPIPIGFTVYNGQLSKDELSFFFTASNGGYSLLFELTRATITDTFNINTFQQIQGINDTFQNNIQPSMSDNLNWVAFVRNNTGFWDGDELYIAHKGKSTSLFNQEVNPFSASLFPNPTNGQFTILLQSDKAEIIVADILGQEIIKTTAIQKSTNLLLDKSGVYIVFVKSMQGTLTRKLIVNR